MRIEPSVVTITVDGSGPATQQFRAFGTLDGVERDVTDSVAWLLDDLTCAGMADGGLLTATGRCGGRYIVKATTGAATALATVTIRNVRTFSDPAATPAIPPSPTTWFDGTPGTNADLTPEVVYPYDGVLLPPNLNTIEIQFRRSYMTDLLFEMNFSNEMTDVRVYTRCIGTGLDWNGCAAQLNGDAWVAVAQTNRGGAAVNLKVRAAADASSPGAFGESAAQTMSFTKDDLKGVVYYWTTSGTASETAIYRWDFGSTTQTAPEVVVTTAATSGDCLGCHALSRDGSKIIASVGTYLNNGGRLLLWDVAKNAAAQPFPLADRANFMAWNTDGSQFVGVYGDKGAKGELVLFDGTTGARTGAISIGDLRADHPDWSLNGSHVVFTSVPADSNNDEQTYMGAIDFVEQTSSGWSAPAELVPAEADKHRYYPAVAPDEGMIVFNESICPTGQPRSGDCDGDSDPSARIWMTRFPPADSTPVLLTNANKPGKLDSDELKMKNSYAKWSPFEFNLTEMGDKVMWATMSSGRKYGMRNTSGYWLWMFAVNPAKAGDPSFAPFWLPFQNLATSNHTAQWTTKVPPPVP
jgi:hypothetical protein